MVFFQLHDDLVNLQYRHGFYDYFYVFDPKERHISKASIRDRLVHQMVFSTLTDVLIKSLFFTRFRAPHRDCVSGNI